VPSTFTIVPTRGSCGNTQSVTVAVNILPPPVTPTTNNVTVNVAIVPLIVTVESVAPPNTTGGILTITGSNFGLDGPFASFESVSVALARSDQGTVVCSGAMVSSSGTVITCDMPQGFGNGSISMNLCNNNQALQDFAFPSPTIYDVLGSNLSFFIKGINFGPPRTFLTANGDSALINGDIPCTVQTVNHTQIACHTAQTLVVGEIYYMLLSIGGQVANHTFNFTNTGVPSVTTGHLAGPVASTGQQSTAVVSSGVRIIDGAAFATLVRSISIVLVLAIIQQLTYDHLLPLQ